VLVAAPHVWNAQLLTLVLSAKVMPFYQLVNAPVKMASTWTPCSTLAKSASHPAKHVRVVINANPAHLVSN